jgi:hypothetical protein
MSIIFQRAPWHHPLIVWPVMAEEAFHILFKRETPSRKVFASQMISFQTFGNAPELSLRTGIIYSTLVPRLPIFVANIALWYARDSSSANQLLMLTKERHLHPNPIFHLCWVLCKGRHSWPQAHFQFLHRVKILWK